LTFLSIIMYNIMYKRYDNKGGVDVEILPITEMRNTQKISELCSKEPVFITKNGSGHLVIQSHEEYNRKEEELELCRMILEAERDQLENGNKMQDFDEFAAEVRKKYGIQS